MEGTTRGQFQTSWRCNSGSSPRAPHYASETAQLNKNNILRPKREVESINLYKGGTSKILGINKIVKLSSNESPFGPSEKAMKAYEETSNKLSRYPELTADSRMHSMFVDIAHSTP